MLCRTACVLITNSKRNRQYHNNLTLLILVIILSILNECFDFNNNKLNCRKRNAALRRVRAGRFWLSIERETIASKATVALSVGRTRAPGHMVWPTNWIPSGGPRDSVIPHRVRHSLGPVANRTSRRLLEGKKSDPIRNWRRKTDGRFSKAKTRRAWPFVGGIIFFACSTSICLTKIRGCRSRTNRIWNRFRGKKKFFSSKIKKFWEIAAI